MSTDEKDIMCKLDLLLRTGCMLIECLADTSRVMRNMRRTADFLGLPEEQLHIYISYNMLMANLTDGLHSYTQFRRCGGHRVNMAGLSAISHLTWRCIRRNYSLQDYRRSLENITGRKPCYTPWQVAAGGGFACGGFCIQFGCDWTAFFYASVAAIIGSRLRMCLGARGWNEYVGIGTGAFVATIIAWLTSFISTSPAIAAALPSCLVSSTPWHPLLACALFIVPGVPLINFVSDMLDGYIQTGITRAVKTLMMVLAMAFGIAMAIKVCGIDNFVRDLSMTPHHEYWEFALAASISAMGFSMIFNLPRRLLPAVAAGGVIAVCTRNFINLGPSNGNVGLDMGLAMGSLAGSALASVVATQVIHRLDVPHHCLAIPSVIPMIPGVLMYRSLFAFIDMHGVVGEVTVAIHNGILASLTILCIAIGVAIPNIFFRKMISPKRQQLLLDLLIKRKKMRGDFVNLGSME